MRATRLKLCDFPAICESKYIIFKQYISYNACPAHLTCNHSKNTNNVTVELYKKILLLK